MHIPILASQPLVAKGLKEQTSRTHVALEPAEDLHTIHAACPSLAVGHIHSQACAYLLNLRARPICLRRTEGGGSVREGVGKTIYVASVSRGLAVNNCKPLKHKENACRRLQHEL